MFPSKRPRQSLVGEREREFDYLLAEEREERGERRGLEQRAAGLTAALLVAFPISATVAREADTADTLAGIGLVLLGLALLVAVAQAAALTRALGPPKRERNKVRNARTAVSQSLAEGDLKRAVAEQRKIVATIRNDNGTLVRNVRRVTGRLPYTLAGLLVALTLVVLAKHNGTCHVASSLTHGSTTVLVCGP